MDFKFIRTTIGYMVLIMIFFPVLINSLMFFDITPVKGEVSIWIGTLGTFWGAVIGGGISGILTLVGVQKSINASFKGLEKTVNHQEKERIKESMGVKLNKLYSVKKIIYELDRMLSNRKYGWNVNYVEAKPELIDRAIYDYILPRHNKLLEDASSVDWDFFY